MINCGSTFQTRVFRKSISEEEYCIIIMQNRYADCQNKKSSIAFIFKCTGMILFGSNTIHSELQKSPSKQIADNRRKTSSQSELASLGCGPWKRRKYLFGNFSAVLIKLISSFNLKLPFGVGFHCGILPVGRKSAPLKIAGCKAPTGTQDSPGGHQ